jgi:uncharacterized Fe-S center protein
MNKSKVYFTEKITPESLVDIYRKLYIELSGKVSVKVNSGEPGGHNYLKPEFMKELIRNNSRMQHCISRAKEYVRGTLEGH